MDALLTELHRLDKGPKVPSPIDYGINGNKYFSLLTTMAEQALASGSPNNNPRAPSVDEMNVLYKELLGS